MYKISRPSVLREEIPGAGAGTKPGGGGGAGGVWKPPSPAGQLTLK